MRRRARATRRVKPSTTKKRDASTSSETKAGAPSDSVAPEVDAAAITNAMADVPVEVAPVVPVAVPSIWSDEGRRERVNRVADEAKKVFAGGQYDESIIGSDDHETRRLVGAELASALVGRDAARLLDLIVTRNVLKAEVGQVLYTPWCDHAGKVIDVGLAGVIGADRLVNALAA